MCFQRSLGEVSDGASGDAGDDAVCWVIFADDVGKGIDGSAIGDVGAEAEIGERRAGAAHEGGVNATHAGVPPRGDAGEGLIRAAFGCAECVGFERFEESAGAEHVIETGLAVGASAENVYGEIGLSGDGCAGVKVVQTADEDASGTVRGGVVQGGGAVGGGEDERFAPDTGDGVVAGRVAKIKAADEDAATFAAEEAGVVGSGGFEREGLVGCLHGDDFAGVGSECGGDGAAGAEEIDDDDAIAAERGGVGQCWKQRRGAAKRRSGGGHQDQSAMTCSVGTSAASTWVLKWS